MSQSTTSKRWSRREALEVMAAGMALSVGCSNGSPTSPTAATTTTTATTGGTTTTPPTSTSTCVTTPNETAGPFPSITVPVRSDVREDRTGLPLALTLTVVNTSSACAPVAAANVEIWQCDAQGNYSEYGALTSSTWLRGVQPTDSNGRATFTTIYPGWYAGRVTHIHIEVSVNGRSVKTTQIAFPEEVTAAVYASGVYAAKGQNPTKNAGDMVFSDGVTSQLASLVGSTAAGYTATFTIGIAL